MEECESNIEFIRGAEGCVWVLNFVLVLLIELRHMAKLVVCLCMRGACVVASSRWVAGHLGEGGAYLSGRSACCGCVVEVGVWVCARNSRVIV